MADILVQVEGQRAKREAQRDMERSVRSSLASRGVRNIGFPSGNRDETLYSAGDGKLWCAFGDAERAKVPRRWNAFGVFEDRRRTQMITVEVNIPTATNSAAVAGFFANDPATGAVYLMHDGGIGGGKSGVGQRAFLAWTARKLVPVERSRRESREAFLIGRVDAANLPERLWNYVQEVRNFKDAVKRGDLDTSAFRKQVADWDKYRREKAGRRRGRRRAEIDYISYHGDVVDALWAEREARKTAGEVVKNSPLIDLLVKSGKATTEIYEVKTSVGRQSLYTAVGQLMTHSVGAATDVKRVLVVPEGRIADDLDRCLSGLGIETWRFRLTGGAKRKKILLIA
ncbi:MAG TPA: hypothetical protein VFP12_12890 [Allosphingosinicella sp.]|nr:hypothetical protein [Allosphingosinicella sp.]